MGGATVAGICYREGKRKPMLEIKQAMLTAEKGVGDDFRGKPGQRQVTVISLQQWQQACTELGAQLPWTTRRANIAVTGLSFSADCVGKTLRIGDCVLRINGETDPCERMDEACEGLRKALEPEWRGGVLCSVIEAGEVACGDQVELLGDGLKL